MNRIAIIESSVKSLWLNAVKDFLNPTPTISPTLGYSPSGKCDA